MLQGQVVSLFLPAFSGARLAAKQADFFRSPALFQLSWDGSPSEEGEGWTTQRLPGPDVFVQLPRESVS